MTREEFAELKTGDLVSDKEYHLVVLGFIEDIPVCAGTSLGDKLSLTWLPDFDECLKWRRMA